MAAVVRVKRRIDEDPAEALLISCKRQRQDGGLGAVCTDVDTKIRFSYAGTLNSKEAPVARQIRDAIRKDDLQAHYKHHVNRISETRRSDRRAAAKASRYKVVCQRRAADLASSGDASLSDFDSENGQLSEPNIQIHNGHEAETQMLTVREYEVTEPDTSSDSGDHQSIARCANALRSGDVETPSETARDSAEPVEQASERNALQVEEINSGGVEGGEEVLRVYDVEQDEEDNNSVEGVDSLSDQASGSGITVNGIELVRERIPAMRRRAEEGYVYDLYYTSNREYDFRALENILSIQALHDELVLQGDRDEDCDEVYEDEDDSNDEDNWRNDYPDEDPHFFENATAEYYYGDDMLAREPEAFDYGEDDDLADWMSARCNVADDDVLSSEEDDDEDDVYSGRRRRVNYAHYVQHGESESD